MTDEGYFHLVLVALGTIIFVLGVLVLADDFDHWDAQDKCRQTHNVYQCERIYVPVTTQEDKP